MVEKGSGNVKTDDVTYISDKLGLHRVGTTSHSNAAVTGYLYLSPFQSAFASVQHRVENLKYQLVFGVSTGKIHCNADGETTYNS